MYTVDELAYARFIDYRAERRSFVSLSRCRDPDKYRSSDRKRLSRGSATPRRVQESSSSTESFLEPRRGDRDLEPRTRSLDRSEIREYRSATTASIFNNETVSVFRVAVGGMIASVSGPRRTASNRVEPRRSATTRRTLWTFLSSI